MLLMSVCVSTSVAGTAFTVVFGNAISVLFMIFSGKFSFSIMAGMLFGDGPVVSTALFGG